MLQAALSEESETPDLDVLPGPGVGSVESATPWADPWVKSIRE